MVEVLPFGLMEAEMAAQLDAELIRKNQVIGLRDVFIAGSALSQGLKLLTKNVEHFQRIPSLQLVEVA